MASRYTAAMRRWILAWAVLATACSTSDGVSPAVEPSAAPSVANHSDAATESVSATAPSAAGEQHEVRADDGHSVALWAKVPEDPRGAILLIHGRTWSGRPDFDLQVEGEERSTMDMLVREGYAAFAIDLRGYGATKRDATGWNTPDRAAKDVFAVLRYIREQTGAEKVAILGWSLGSLTTQLVAQRHPDLVSAAILFGYPRRVGHRYQPTPKGAKPARAKTTAKAAAEDFIAPGVMSQPAIDAFVKAALASDPIKADWWRTEEWNELDPAKVNVPTLLIHGELDPYAPAKNQAELFAQLGDPDRTYVIVAGGDHAAHLEDTAPRFVQAVVSFLERPRLPPSKK